MLLYTEADRTFRNHHLYVPDRQISKSADSLHLLLLKAFIFSQYIRFYMLWLVYCLCAFSIIFLSN